MVLAAGMGADEVGQVGEELVYRDARGFVRLGAEKAKIAAGDLDAVLHLAVDRLQPVFNEGQIGDFEPGRITDAQAHELAVAGDGGKGPANIVDDAGVNLAAGGGDLLVGSLVEQFAEQLLQFVRFAVEVAIEGRSEEHTSEL